MSTPTKEEIQLADSWWSDARRSDSHFAPHADHVHVFRSAASAAKAAENKGSPCDEWPRIAGHSVLTIATVSDFDLKFTPSTKTYTQWVSDAIAHGAVAVSIRAAVEPAKISAEEMRRQFKRVRSDIEDAHRNNKMARGEREENLSLLAQISRAYDTGGFPTLHDASVLMAFNGRREERKLMPSSCATVRLMENLQMQALSEMQLASSVRANPNKHELPSPVVACSGITSMNRVGDRKGVLLGFDERDQQPAYLDHRATSESDAYPIMAILGATGSGKAVELSTTIPTPTGTTTMGDLTRGDVVLGRDGKPCTVTHLSEITTPERAYRITLSDGQTIDACSNHQWLVAGSPLDHATPSTSEALVRAAMSTTSLRLDVEGIHTVTRGIGAPIPAAMIRPMLDMVDVRCDNELKYELREALIMLAARTRQQTAGSNVGLVVLSTEEILATGRDGWGIPLPETSVDALGTPLDERLDLFHSADSSEDPERFAAVARSLGYHARITSGGVDLDLERSTLAIESIEPIEPVPMRCITVDSPDSTYLVEGFVPTHNTMVALNIADQLQAMGAPVVFIDPKTHTEGEGHAPVVRAMGGTVASLDSLLGSDGVFDPVRFMADRQSAVETATNLLLQINPWGWQKDTYEVSLGAALQHGIMMRGANCLGQALRYAFEDGMLEGHEDVFHKCEQLKDSSPLFGALYGRDPKGNALNINDGVTLIEVGKTALPVPEPGVPPETITQRVAAALVRMMVFGSANAVTGRFGTVMLDEAWVFMAAGKSEIDRLGRLARSQKVLPVLLTQKVTDLVNAGLSGYISRGLILHLGDVDEARAALQLFKVEDSQERMERIPARERADADDEDGGGALNPKSLKALVSEEPDPDIPGMKRRVVHRGSVAFYSDLSGRFIPVEMVLPEEFLLMASTNPLDIQRRERVLAARRREQAVRRRRAESSEVDVDEFDRMMEVTRDEGRKEVESLFEAKEEQGVSAPSSRQRKGTSAEELEELFGS